MEKERERSACDKEQGQGELRQRTDVCSLVGGENASSPFDKALHNKGKKRKEKKKSALSTKLFIFECRVS